MDNKPAANSTFAIGGVSCSADSFVVDESSVLRINICATNPAHRKSANRWQQAKKMNRTIKYGLITILILTIGLFVAYGVFINNFDLFGEPEKEILKIRIF